MYLFILTVHPYPASVLPKVVSFTPPRFLPVEHQTVPVYSDSCSSGGFGGFGQKNTPLGVRAKGPTVGARLGDPPIHRPPRLFGRRN